MLASVAAIIALSLIVLAFGKRLFSLTKAQLWSVAGLQTARILASTALLALCWSIALPAVALFWWLLLATVRLMLARLPLLTNKDVLFAGAAGFLLHGAGRGMQDVTALMALMATITLATHLLVGGLLAVADLVTVDRSDKEKA